MYFSLSNHVNDDNANVNDANNANNANNANININNNINANGYRLLSAQGMETLQAFLRDHGNECIKQFVKVISLLLRGRNFGGEWAKMGVGPWIAMVLLRV